MDQIIEIINKDRINKEDAQVQYSIINFEETQRKIQIDILNGRTGDYCNYLKQFNVNKQINISNLFLARMIKES